MPGGPTNVRERLLAWAPLAVAAAILIWHSLQFNFVTDDAYISFVFSRNFAEHGQLSFNLGQPVEGYTNFLWTVILGVLMLVGIDPSVSSRVLGTACAVGTLFVTYRLMRRVLGDRAMPWAYVPAFLLAASSGFACWSSGGLETQLFTLLVILAIDAYVSSFGAAHSGRPLMRMGVFLALAAMTRPEGLMILAIIGLHRLAMNAFGERRIVPTRAEWLGAAAFLILWAPWFAWRWHYYGWPFPNTYYVKAHGPWASPKMATEMWSNGFYYLWVWFKQTRLIWVSPIALIGLLAAWPHINRQRFALTSLSILLGGIYLVYTASVGGDFMGLHRFIMPLFVLAAIAVTLGLETVSTWIGSAIRIPIVAIVIAVVSFVGFAWMHLHLVFPYDLIAIASAPEFKGLHYVVIPVLALTALIIGACVARNVAVVIAVIVVVGFAWTQFGLTSDSVRFGNFANDRGIDTPAFLITYTEDRAKIGRAMESCFKPDDFSIVGGAGSQPYYGRMRAIDVFGLISERIAHEEPRTRARAGHTKFGNDGLLSSYDPTFVFSCYDITRDAKQPRLPCAGFWLGRGYEEVTMHVPGMQERGEYYTFLAKKSRNFQCDGRVQ